MRHLTIDVSNYDSRLHIGKQGENLTREITFDCASWLDGLTGGVLSIVHQRPSDPDAYPCGDYVTDDTSLTWSINETDVAFSGLGKCELRYTIGSRIAKTKTFYTEIVNALNPLDTPPEAYEPYIDRVIDAARWEMDALSVGGTASETERLSVQIDKIVPVDPDDGYGIYFRFGIPKGADGKGVSNATASVDNNTGTPSVTVTTTDTEEGIDIDFSFHNLKGATGAAGQDGDSVGTVTASVDNNTGTPSVTVTTSGGSGSPVGIDLAFHNLKGQSFDTSFLPSDTASGSPATFPDGAKNVAVDELVTTIAPQQDLHGYDKPWAAGAGKNKFDVAFLTASGITIENGSATGTATAFYTSFARSKGGVPISINWSGQYTLSLEAYTDGNVSTSGSGLIVAFEYSDGTNTNVSFPNNTSSYTAFSVSSTLGKTITGIWISFGTNQGNNWHLRNIQLEEGSSATTYVPYSNVCPISGWTQAEITHNGDTDTIPFGQTVYGGSLNVTTGVLTIDKGFLSDLSQLNWDYHSSTYRNIFSALVDGIYSVTEAADRNKWFVCSEYAPSVATSVNNSMDNGGALVAGQRLKLRNDAYEGNLAGFVSSAAGVQFAYRLADEIVVHLTPDEVRTVLGNNSISANTGSVSVRYRADIGLYIDKKLA